MQAGVRRVGVGDVESNLAKGIFWRVLFYSISVLGTSTYSSAVFMQKRLLVNT
jgi:hypothetical protein